MNPPPIIITHNFAPNDFMWLWAKYVVGFNERYHCTNCLRGRYSTRFSKARNPHLATERTLVFDEHSGHEAVYICGVARMGYSTKRNYEHNVHLAVRPAVGVSSLYQFEDWRVAIENGVIQSIPRQDELPLDLRQLPPSFTTCRIFRWAACSLRVSPESRHSEQHS